jgi:energy-coupling factor transporter transmembrane protein EcfT
LKEWIEAWTGNGQVDPSLTPGSSIHVLFLIVILLRWLNMVEAKLPTLNEIKKHIPARCFEVSHYPRDTGSLQVGGVLNQNRYSLVVMSSRTQQKSLLRSLFYMIRDFGILAALYYAYPAFESRGLGGLFVWWNLTGKLQCS